MRKNKEMFWLTIILIISFVIVVSYKITEDIPELFIGADFCYNLVSQLGLAFIGSYIFYFVQVYLPEKRKQRIIFKCIKKPLTRIISHIEMTLLKLKDVTIGDIKEFSSLTQIDFVEICSKINPNEQAPMMFNNGLYATYIQYLYNDVIYIKKQYDQLISYVPVIDVEILDIIDEVYNSTYCQMIASCSESKIGNTDISFLAKSMYEYYSKCGRLKEYAIDNDYLMKAASSKTK